MNVKKMTIRISLVAIMSILILATAITILSVSSAFFRNSINWVIEKLTQEVALHIIDKLKNNEKGEKNISFTREFIKEFDISPNGKILLLDDAYYIIAASEKTEGAPIPQRFENMNHKIESVDDPLLTKSFDRFLKNEKKKDRKLFKRKFDHFTFWHDWKKYISIYEPFEISPGKTWVVAIVFPFSDFFQSITRNNIILYSITGFFVLLAFFISLNISRKISKPLTALAEATDKIRNFELEPTGHINSYLVEVENMSKAVDNMRSGLKSFKKYVPAELVKELIKLNKEATLGGEKKNMTIFFSDIAGFTTISEKLTPEELVALLGQYLGEMTRVLLNHKGTVDKYIGDAIMAFWGAPNDLSDHASWACKSALAYQERLAELGNEWRSMNKPVFTSRIGINTGDIIVGNMGYEERMNYTVIGDAVNLASRIEGINKNYGTQIMIGEETYSSVSSQFETRLIDIVAVKGKEKGTRIYELIGTRGNIHKQKSDNRICYHEGLEYYLQKDFEKGKKLFSDALALYPEDDASKVFIKRCDEFLKNPPDKDWDGVYIAKTK